MSQKGNKVYIAILAYDGRIDVGTCGALFDNIENLKNNGYEVKHYFEIGCCYLPQARNTCVANFLETDCDYMIFVDSDLWFDQTAMFKLLSFKKDLICGAYPFRAGTDGFPIKVFTNEDGTPKVEEETGLIEIEGGATGLMCIKRELLETMKKNNPTWETARETTRKNKIYAIFDTGMLWKNDKHWYGEDFLFCYRVIENGFKIFCYPNINFLHIGRQARVGNYHEYLSNLPKPEKVNKNAE